MEWKDETLFVAIRRLNREIPALNFTSHRQFDPIERTINLPRERGGYDFYYIAASASAESIDNVVRPAALIVLSILVSLVFH